MNSPFKILCTVGKKYSVLWQTSSQELRGGQTKDVVNLAVNMFDHALCSCSCWTPNWFVLGFPPKMNMHKDASDSSWSAAISITKDCLDQHKRKRFYGNATFIDDWFVGVVSGLIVCLNNCLLSRTVMGGNRTQLSCMKTHMHEKFIVLYFLVCGEYKESTCWKTMNRSTNYLSFFKNQVSLQN